MTRAVADAWALTLASDSAPKAGATLKAAVVSNELLMKLRRLSLFNGRFSFVFIRVPSWLRRLVTA